MCSILAEADRAVAHWAAARAAAVRAVADVARTGIWEADGAGDLAAWACARWQLSRATATELVRDAETLAARPPLLDALASGQISVDQCRALSVLCEEGSDDAELWLEALPFWSFHELEREARKKKARELEARDGGTYLRMRHTRDERFMRGEFQLHPGDGA